LCTFDIDCIKYGKTECIDPLRYLQLEEKYKRDLNEDYISTYKIFYSNGSNTFPTTTIIKIWDIMWWPKDEIK
jgi:hypothetical protein